MSRRSPIHRLAPLFLMLAGTAAGVALLGVAELALRVVDVGSPTRVFEADRDEAGRPIVRLAWNPQFARPYAGDMTQRSFPADKPPGTYRIFVVGESSAEGSPYGSDLAFSGVLARRLAAEAPDVHWEVVNAALAGGMSWSELIVVRDLARYEPDLLVVYLGHNEVGTRFTPEERRRLQPRQSLLGWITSLRLYHVTASLVPASMRREELDLRKVHRPGETFAVLAPGSTRRYA